MGNTFQNYSQHPASATSNLANDQTKRSNLNYGVVHNSGDSFDESFHVKRFVSQSPPKRHDNENDGEECFDGSHVIQLEKDTLKLRRELQIATQAASEAISSKKNADSRILAYVLELLPSSKVGLTSVSFVCFSLNSSLFFTL